MSDKTFRRANNRVEQLRIKPAIAKTVRGLGAEREAMSRVCVDGLADIRKVGNLTQAQMVELLGTPPPECDEHRGQ